MNILPCEIKNGEVNVGGQKISIYKPIKKSGWEDIFGGYIIRIIDIMLMVN